MVQMLRKENKSYSFTDFGDLLHTSMYQILTRKIKKKRTYLILEKQYLLVHILEKKTNPSHYKLQMCFYPKLS